MLIHMPHPDDVVTIHESHTCEHHKRQPWDVAWPGCTCSGSYYTRKATPEEREQNRKNRLAEEERRRKHMANYDAGLLKEVAIVYFMRGMLRSADARYRGDNRLRSAGVLGLDGAGDAYASY